MRCFAQKILNFKLNEGESIIMILTDEQKAMLDGKYGEGAA